MSSSKSDSIPEDIPESLRDIGAPLENGKPKEGHPQKYWPSGRVIEIEKWTYFILGTPGTEAGNRNFRRWPTPQGQMQFISPDTFDNVLLPTLESKGADANALDYLKKQYEEADRLRQTPQPQSHLDGGYQWEDGYEGKERHVTITQYAAHIYGHESDKDESVLAEDLNKLVKHAEKMLPGEEYETFSTLVEEHTRPALLQRDSATSLKALQNSTSPYPATPGVPPGNTPPSGTNVSAGRPPKH